MKTAIINSNGYFANTIINRTQCLPSGTAWAVSAANYERNGLAPNMIGALFGTNFSTSTQVATTNPLPTTLAGTSLKLKDSSGIERQAPLFFVSPGQINFLIPADAVLGIAAVTVLNGNNNVSQGTIKIVRTAPGIFTANASGQGPAAALALRVKANGQQSYESVAQYDAALNRFVTVAIDMSNTAESLFLVLYGTGIRNRSNEMSVAAFIGGERCTVLYAGAQGAFAGLDQINIALPANLPGRGEMEALITVDGKPTTPVRIRLR